MIRMKNENAVHGPCEHWIHHIVFGWHRESTCAGSSMRNRDHCADTQTAAPPNTCKPWLQWSASLAIMRIAAISRCVLICYVGGVVIEGRQERQQHQP